MIPARDEVIHQTRQKTVSSVCFQAKEAESDPGVPLNLIWREKMQRSRVRLLQTQKL